MPQTLPASLRERLRRDEPLWRHTTFRIGGPADLFLAVENEEELIAAVRWAREQSLPYLLLGGGSNVLVADEGVRGLVIANRIHGWRQGRGARPCAPTGRFRISNFEFPSCLLHPASCVPLGRLARAAIKLGWAGLEWAVGIPGTVGGAIVGNAGAHGGCVADNLVAVRVLDEDGKVREVPAAELGFGYRRSVFKKQSTRDEGRAVILSAQFVLRAGDREELEARAAENLAWRRRTQPRGLSAGSVFRNPPGDSAGRLIEAVGLKGACRGGAQISEKHANFIVNRGGATASDVLALIDLARERVWQRFGLTLEPEIEVVGL
ncbi:MAG: UDP-N-acetylmuramate dehydrogenase [Anaerolineae bacterium]|nr:UDP-N-acetylmuramate dehydrogenase [Anaerolineae bacterium]